MADRATSRAMPDSDEALERRLAAVERAVDADATADGSDSDADPEELEARITELESRVDELDAAVQAIRGFLGGVSAVNESVERRADAAVAAVDRLKRRLDDGDADAREPGEGDSDERTANPVDEEGEAAAEDDDRHLRERLRNLQ